MKVSIFKLAGLQLQRENKDHKNSILVLDRAIFIRKWLDKHSQATAIKILAGDKNYQYGNKIKTYKGVKK